jgi:UDP-2,3-diacylglucosamine hydrolase
MKLAFISDVHLKENRPDNLNSFNNFLSHDLVINCDEVYFLGDIFDLLCGNHIEYLQKYNQVFLKLNELGKRNIHLIFFEGNHDLHFEELFKKYFYEIQLTIFKSPQIIQRDNKSFYLSHGDEIDLLDRVYQNYKKIISSKPLEYFAKKIMPYHVLEFLGKNASQISKEKGKKTFNLERQKKSIRDQLVNLNKSADFLICGHTHIKDQFALNEGRTTYYNNGYFPQEKNFIYWDGESISFQSIS